MWLKSDNAAGVDRAVLQALSDCNAGIAESYGDDEYSRRLEKAFCRLFEHECRVFPVASGTAANSLGLASIAKPFDWIACHEEAHARLNESGATTLMSGGADFLPIRGEHGRIAAADLSARLDALAPSNHGALQAGALTVTQLTERGTAYLAEDLADLCAVARDHGLAIHLDGARFANALVGCNSSPADMSWRVGVDVMSFGATKNGTMYADAVVFFDTRKAENFRQRLKRAGHSLSKTRYLAAQLLAYIDEDRWLNNARHANAMASRIAAAISRTQGAELSERTDGNMVFASISPDRVEHLKRRAIELRSKGMAKDGNQIFRLVASFATTVEEVERFEEALAS